MEDQVPFKVYTFWTRHEQPEVRRFGVEKSVVTSFHYLNAKLQDVYPGLKTKTYSVAWKDEDGDDVVVSSDDEVMTALQALSGDVIKLYVYCKAEEAKDDDCDIILTAVTGNSSGAPDTPAVHYGVMCDSCDSSVVGFRYKCSVCDDYDLCSRCEAAGKHPEHCMVRVPTPNMSRTVIKAAIKRSRHFLKSVATAMGEDCPYKKHRAERGAERKHRGGHGPHAEHGEHSRRRQRVSWLDTFTTYMNEFANLAGDIDIGEDRPRPEEAKTPNQTETQGQVPQGTQAKPQTNTQSTQAKQPEPTTSAYAQTQCPFGSSRPHGPTAINVKDLIQTFLRNLPEQGIYMPQPTQPQNAATNPPNTPAPSAAPANDVEMGQGDRKAAEPDDNTVKSMSAGSSVNEYPRDASPDKADDWTVINKEKDLMDTASAPAEAAAPIGFNLPEEFQERVKIAEGGLYPPLNTSTAGHESSLLTLADRLVLNLKEPAVQKPSAPAAPAAAPAPKPQEQPPPTTSAAPTTPPRQRHPKPHIDAAIQQMLAMGFTNEGGWLTQLLESKDGNIAAVLDLLTPVNPKK